MANPTRFLILGAALTLTAAGCGGEVEHELTPEDEVTSRAEESCALQWWNSPPTYDHNVFGWDDHDLGVSANTPIQLRHNSKLLNHGVYGWGYMPEFQDMVTGYRFRFLHLRPQHQYATQNGHVYPAGYIVGISGGDTRDTGLGTYSTGAHLCLQTLVSFRTAFPPGGGGSCGGGDPSSGGHPGGGTASCHSATLNRVVGHNTCVQSSADGKWYKCENGSWVASHSGCGLSYSFCHSQTLNRWVAPRTCVQSRADHVWYQCDHIGWNAPVSQGRGPVGVCSAMYHL